ncbi:MAG: hypothetical protein JSW33_11495 [bacterium]|nr:MAG: hypothetical protein JSW33_11495 [bacterium]
MMEDLIVQNDQNKLVDQVKNDTIADFLKTENQFKNGANWFYWIAALSVINSLIILFGGEISFIVGLGITQIVDAVSWELKNSEGMNLDYLFFMVSLFISGVFVIFGYFSRKRMTSVYITGMVLYAADGLIFLLVGDWLSIGFHVFVLFSLFGGLKALKTINASYQPELSMNKPIG